MALIRPRLTDYFGISSAQADLDFAIPFLDEDIPLYVDPFLLWRSPSQQDQSLHTALTNSFNRLNWLVEEVGLGLSATRKGKRIGRKTAEDTLALFRMIPEYERYGFTHFEEIQLYVDGISKDRISDVACSFLKSFLIDFTIDQCSDLGIPMRKVKIRTLYDYREHKFRQDVEVTLPVSPQNNAPILLVPKRWLRFVPWINFDDYFAKSCPKDEVVNAQGSDDRVRVLMYNRENYGVVNSYIKAKELAAQDCQSDPLFKQIPVISARRKLADIKGISSGNKDKADKKYEDAATSLLASLMYPHLDFAETQSRSESGSTIRDLVFYNNRKIDFLQELLIDYSSRQIVMELKNVQAVERDHINQLNRYLTNEFGSFGVMVTRHPLSKAMFKNTIDLWAGQRRCIVILTDSDLEMMVEVFESKQRSPIEVLKKKYLEFRRACPS